MQTSFLFLQPSQLKGALTISIDTITHHLFLPTAQYGEAPAPTSENPHPRTSIKPGTFEIIEVGTY